MAGLKPWTIMIHTSGVYTRPWHLYWIMNNGYDNWYNACIENYDVLRSWKYRLCQHFFNSGAAGHLQKLIKDIFFDPLWNKGWILWKLNIRNLCFFSWRNNILKTIKSQNGMISVIEAPEYPHNESTGCPNIFLTERCLKYCHIQAERCLNTSYIDIIFLPRLLASLAQNF